MKRPDHFHGQWKSLAIRIPYLPGEDDGRPFNLLREKLARHGVFRRITNDDKPAPGGLIAMVDVEKFYAVSGAKRFWLWFCVGHAHVQYDVHVLDEHQVEVGHFRVGGFSSYMIGTTGAALRNAAYAFADYFDDSVAHSEWPAYSAEVPIPELPVVYTASRPDRSTVDDDSDDDPAASADE